MHPRLFVVAAAAAFAWNIAPAAAQQPLGPQAVEEEAGAAGPPREPAILRATPRTAAPGADELQKLQIERYNAAVAELDVCRRMREAGSRSMTNEKLLEPAGRLLESELELSDVPADHVAALERYLELVKYVEAGVVSAAEYGEVGGTRDLVLAARSRTLEVEVRLLKAKRKAAAAKKK